MDLFQLIAILEISFKFFMFLEFNKVCLKPDCLKQHLKNPPDQWFRILGLGTVVKRL